MRLIPYLDHVLFKVSPGFRWGMGAVEDASIYLRRYSRSQKLIGSAMRVKRKGWRDWGIGISRVPLRTSPKTIYSAKVIAFFFKERTWTELASNTGGFSFHGIAETYSPPGAAIPAAARVGGR